MNIIIFAIPDAWISNFYDAIFNQLAWVTSHTPMIYIYILYIRQIYDIIANSICRFTRFCCQYIYIHILHIATSIATHQMQQAKACILIIITCKVAILPSRQLMYGEQNLRPLRPVNKSQNRTLQKRNLQNFMCFDIEYLAFKVCEIYVIVIQKSEVIA